MTPVQTPAWTFQPAIVTTPSAPGSTQVSWHFNAPAAGSAVSTSASTVNGSTYVNPNPATAVLAGVTPDSLLSQLPPALRPGGTPFYYDPFTENQKLQQAALAQTGQSSFVNGLTYDSQHRLSVTDQEKLILYGNAADYARAHNIQLGQALTQQQIAQLDKPMLWYVTQQVPDPNCNTVASTACAMVSALVPQLYLPAGYADAITQPAGGVIAGSNVNVNVDGTLRNSGQITAADTLNVHAGRIDAAPNVVNVGTSAYKVEGGWLEVSGTQVQPGGFMSALHLNVTANSINAINEAFIVRNPDGTTNQAASDALVAQLKANLGLNYTSGTVKDDIHQNFIKEESGFGPLGQVVAIVVAVALAIITAGAGAAVLAAVGSTLTGTAAAVAGAAISGAIAGTLSSMASQVILTGSMNLGTALKSGAISAVTAGVTAGALAALGLSSAAIKSVGGNISKGNWAAVQANIGQYAEASVVRSAISAGINSAAFGGSFGQAFAGGLVRDAAAVGANMLGTLSPGIGEVNASADSVVGNILGHIALGCATSSIQGTGCAGGAAGGLAGSVVAPLVGTGLYSGVSGENKAIDAATVAIAGLAGGAIAQAIGGDATAGASTAQNSAMNNWLDHRRPNPMVYSEQERRDHAAAACSSVNAKDCDVADRLDAESRRRDAELQAACVILSSDECRGAMAAAKAAGNRIEFAGGKVYAVDPNAPAIRSLAPNPVATMFDRMLGSTFAGISAGLQYLNPNADPAAGAKAAEYGMALEGIGAGVLGLPTGPLAGPGWRAALESPNTFYVGSGAGSALPTWTNVAGPYSAVGQGGGAATTVRAGPGYAAGDVLPGGSTGSVWNLPPTDRGVAIESRLATTEYSAANGWYNVGAANNGYFPLVDFQNGTTLVSLKSVDTTGTSWQSRMETVINQLGAGRATVNGAPANMVLDLRVQPGGAAAAQYLVSYGAARGVTVIIKAFP
ncbi:DUF637 domain-containing protein [Ralstonia solanacearum]|uniref:DUF637 domain-containing protein n=1 Tax=Ralstonia solanacearum TaxID=305 RepID=UPI001BDE895A|nr:DUF637 domain-containing protein [Ralstonia solanacearum]MBT1535686.1 DUF637 domain-containing protein [Ralstonia solanacearum]